MVAETTHHWSVDPDGRVDPNTVDKKFNQRSG